MATNPLITFGEHAAEGIPASRNAYDQKIQAERQYQIAPYALNVKDLQQKLQTVQPNSPEHQQIIDQMQHNIHSMREILHPDWKPGPTEWLKTHLTDRLHITNANKRAQEHNAQAAQNRNWEQAMTQADVGAAPQNPYLQTESEMRASGFSPQDIQMAIRENAGLVPKDTTEQERFVTTYKTQHPGATDEQALRAYTDATKPPKVPKGFKPLGSSGNVFGLQNLDDGKEYFPSQLGPNGDAPPEAKQMWNAIQTQEAATREEQQKKEDEQNKRFLEAQEAIAKRMGQTEQWQARMANYRADLTTYRTLDKQARDDEATVKMYETEASQPGNKSAFDTALVTDYTGILAKGGRKTQAEIRFAQQIGGFGLRADNLYHKAQSGELPPQMRQMYIDYMKARAASERAEADSAKPALPEVAGAPQGPKTKKLKAARAASSLAQRLSDALDGK